MRSAVNSNERLQRADVARRGNKTPQQAPAAAQPLDGGGIADAVSCEPLPRSQLFACSSFVDPLSLFNLPLSMT